MKFDKVLTLSSCWGFDLVVGGLIIGYFESVIYLAIDFFNGERSDILSIWEIIVLFGNCLLIFGIHKRKANWLLPDIVISLIWLGILLVMWVLLPLTVPFKAQIVRYRSNERHNPYVQQHLESEITDRILLTWIIVTVCLVYKWYTTSVKYSLYRNMKSSTNEMKERDQGNVV